MKRYLPLIVLVLINLIIGLFVVSRYGESIDEQSQRRYGERNVQAIETLIGTGTFYFKESAKQGSHGPAFIMVVASLRDLFIPDGSLAEKLQFGHFLYFIMFQIGTVSLFFLARRWVSEAAAFGTALLFNTQPLFVGHAFMNPKDVVFMSLSIVCAVLGLWMVDRDEKVLPSTGWTFSDGIRSFLRQFLRGDVWLAGFLLGFSSAIRVAPLIGLVVLAYILVSRKWRMLPRFFAYGVIAFFFMLVLWPYLWPDPIRRLMESLLNSAHYPGQHLTLFRGVLVDSDNIPLSYLPVLLAVQFTETALLLMLVGVVALFKKLRPDLIALILVWFVLPVIAVIGMRVKLYDNFRQIFFLLPPLFLLAGLALDWLFSLVRRRVVYSLILFLILLPGLYADVALYPYQYVYYNQLVGGVRGAYRVFELDYWNLAFMEAQTYINETAGLNANIFAGDARQTAEEFARPDLVFNAYGAKRRNWDNYDYIIVSTAGNADEAFAECKTVFAVKLQGVPLAYVKTSECGRVDAAFSPPRGENTQKDLSADGP